MTDPVCPLNNRACRCDPADEKLRPCMLAKRVGKLIRLQASSFQQEAFNAEAGLRRLLPAEVLSFDDIAVLVENRDCKIEQLKYSDSDVEAIFAHGVEKGRAECQGPMLSAQYSDEDVAKTSLKPNEQEFIDELLARLRWHMPNPGMSGFLLSIFWKLGGSFK